MIGRQEVVFRDIGGIRAAVLLPVLPEDAPPAVREGLARRRLTMVTGECPCGARLTGPNRAQRRRMAKDKAAGHGAVWEVTTYHEADCPANDDILLAAMAAGGAE